MSAVRVFVSGMGGELGTRIAALLEEQPWVGEISGLDIDPPRRHLRRAEFHRVELEDRRRIFDIVRAFDPEVVVHAGVYEPDARATPSRAGRLTAATAIGVLGAAAECPSLQAVVVRSGVEVYGRARGSATRPDETTVPDPTSPFGRHLLEVEHLAVHAARAADVPAALLRLAPVVGPHFPSPLGRYLRQPLVPVSAMGGLPFSVLHQEDAARALVAAAGRRAAGPVNVVGAGAVTPLMAARLGNRLPVPLAGPPWSVARAIARATGAPIPDHVLELILRGRSADGGRAAEVLGVAPLTTTPDAVRHLYEWASVTHLRPTAVAA